jgi:hypothetical protein
VPTRPLPAAGRGAPFHSAAPELTNL